MDHHLPSLSTNHDSGVLLSVETKYGLVVHETCCFAKVVRFPCDTSSVMSTLHKWMEALFP